MLYRWRQIEHKKRLLLWRLYGWFCGLILCGSCFGSVSWASWNRVLFYFYVANKNYPGSISRSDQVMLYAYAYPWRGVFAVTYAIEFLCLTVAKLMVLDRMLDFMMLMTSINSSAAFWKRWASMWRIVMRVAVTGNIVGVCGNIAAAVYYQNVSNSFYAASASYASNTTLGDANGYNYFHSLADEQTRFAHSVASVQSVCEVTVLLLIVAAFLASGISCCRHVLHQLRQFDSGSLPSAAGNSLLQQLMATTGFVFVSFLLRSVFSTIYAAAYMLNDYENTTLKCPGTQWRCDPNCNNDYSHALQWINFTPQFQLIVVLISSPIALLVALWGMTSHSMRQTMRASASQKDMISLKQMSS
jgi:hypothetical protein